MLYLLPLPLIVPLVHRRGPQLLRQAYQLSPRLDQIWIPEPKRHGLLQQQAAVRLLWAQQVHRGQPEDRAVRRPQRQIYPITLRNPRALSLQLKLLGRNKHGTAIVQTERILMCQKLFSIIL